MINIFFLFFLISFIILFILLIILYKIYNSQKYNDKIIFNKWKNRAEKNNLKFKPAKKILDNNTFRYDGSPYNYNNTYYLSHCSRKEDFNIKGKSFDKLNHFTMITIDTNYNFNNIINILLSFFIKDLNLNPNNLFVVSTNHILNYKKLFSNFGITNFVIRNNDLVIKKKNGSGYFFNPLTNEQNYSFSIHYIFNNNFYKINNFNKTNPEDIFESKFCTEIAEGGIPYNNILDRKGFSIGFERLKKCYIIEKKLIKPNKLFTNYEYHRNNIKFQDILKKYNIKMQ